MSVVLRRDCEYKWPEVPDEQKRSLADDAKFLDRLSELDLGLSAALSQSADELPLRPRSEGTGRQEPDKEPGGNEGLASGGPLAARRRPWRTPHAAAAMPLGRFSSSPPPLGERVAGPSMGGAPGPALPPSRLARSYAPMPTGCSGTPDATLTYELFYGFDEQPFGLSSDPKFVYRSASFERATEALLDAIERGDGAMVLTGEQGTGKTTLCLSLVGQLGASKRATLLTDPPASIDALLNAIERSTVVVADAAERWPVEMLEQLHGLAEGAREQRPQLVLVGEPMLAGTLRRRALHALDRCIKTRCRLGPLAADEVAPYVAHRLAVAGTGVRVEFDEGALARLYAISRGVPRVINQVCDAALSAGHRISASRIDAALVAAAADGLNLARPLSRARSIVQAVSMMLAFIALLLVGAAAAAWVFREDIARAVIEWEGRPAVPPAPQPRLLPPLGPIQPPP